MKNKLNYSLNALFIFSLLLFLSCETHEEIINENINQITIETVNLNNLNNKPIDLLKFQSKIEKKSKLKKEGRFIFDSINNFYIDEEFVKYAQSGLKESFTFSIKRENYDKIENILLNKNGDGSFSTYFVKYDFTAEELKTLTQQQIIDKDVEIKPIDFDENGLMRFQQGGYICLESWAYLPVTGQHGELTGTNSITFEWVLTSSFCQYNWNDGGGGYTGYSPPSDSNNPTDYNNYNSGTGSGSSGGGNLGIFTVINPVSLVQQQIKDFKNSLTIEQRDYLFPTPTLDNIEECAEKNEIWNSLVKHLKDNAFSEVSIAFVKELIDVIKNDTNVDSNALSFVLEAKKQDKINNDLDDAFILSIDDKMDIDVASYMLANPTDPLWIHFTIQCAVLRANHPEWSDLKIYWEASKEFIHISLDTLGLVPAFGEVADLTNGVLYTIEGDGVNATLSYASAVPLAGWAAVSTKYAIKINEVASIGTKIKLVWKVTGQVISFGSRNQLRKVLGLLPGNPFQAHHLIPWSSQTKMAVQKAAKSGSAFHMNEALNGIAVAAWRNQPNHNIYNNVINSKLDEFRDLYPNASPNECYEFMTDLVNDIRTWVVNNPNSHLNEIVLP